MTGVQTCALPIFMEWLFNSFLAALMFADLSPKLPPNAKNASFINFMGRINNFEINLYKLKHLISKQLIITNYEKFFHGFFQ